MSRRKLNIKFHDPNTKDEMIDLLANIIAEATSEKALETKKEIIQKEIIKCEKEPA